MIGSHSPERPIIIRRSWVVLGFDLPQDYMRYASLGTDGNGQNLYEDRRPKY
jgi:hypothetical protein